MSLLLVHYFTLYFYLFKFTRHGFAGLPLSGRRLEKRCMREKALRKERVLINKRLSYTV